MAVTYKRTGFKDWVTMAKARVWTAWGFGLDDSKIDYAASNNFAEKARTASGTNNQEIWRVDGDNKLRIGGAVITPMASTINFPLATNASIVTQHFFIAPFAMEITGLSCVYATADGAANTAVVTHETGAQAPGTGATVMNGTFNLNTTTNTVQNATIWVEFPTSGSQSGNFYSTIRMAAGDRLSWKMTSAVTSLAGLVVSIAATPGGKGTMVAYNMQANGDLVDQDFFVCNRDFIVSRIDYVHSTLGTNGSAVTLDVKKCTGTQAPASGTTLLASTFNCKAANNVVQNGALTATSANLRLQFGNRLAVDYTGTLTALAGVVVIVLLQPTESRKEVTWALSKNANMGVTQAFFIADRDYEIVAVSENHSVAAGGVSTLQITRDTLTDAPGAGTSLLGTAFNLNATAETVQVGALTAAPGANTIMAGDRISAKWANAAQSSAGVVVTVTLAIR